MGLVHDAYLKWAQVHGLDLSEFSAVLLDEAQDCTDCQLDAFVRGGYRVTWAPRRQGLGATYEARRDRHRLAVGAAVQSAAFLSELSEGLAGVNLFESDPGATKQLVSAASKLDAVSEGGAQQQRGAARAPKSRRRGAA